MASRQREDGFRGSTRPLDSTTMVLVLCTNLAWAPLDEALRQRVCWGFAKKKDSQTFRKSLQIFQALLEMRLHLRG